MKTKTWIFTLFVTTFALVIIGIAVGIHANNRYLRAMEANGQLTEIRRKSEHLVRALSGLMLAEASEAVVDRVKAGHSQILTDLEKLSASGSTPPELDNIIRVWRGIGKELIFFIDSNPDVQTAGIRDRYGKLLDRFERFLAATDDLDRESLRRAQQVGQYFTAASYGILFLSMLWAGFFAWRISISLRAPISELSQLLSSIRLHSAKTHRQEIDQIVEPIQHHLGNKKNGRPEEVSQLGQSIVDLLFRLGSILEKNSSYAQTLQIESKLLKRETNYDALTLLLNRRCFERELKQALQLSKRYAKSTAVFFIDLDKFKHVNDTLGHTVGDQLLKTVAKRLKLCFRNEDVLCRLGGDEFAAVVSVKNNRRMLKRIAERTVKSMKETFNLDEQKLNISASVGISIYPEDGVAANELIQKADVAMYQAKKAGGSRFLFYREPDKEYASSELCE